MKPVRAILLPVLAVALLSTTALVGLRLDWQTTPNWGVFLGVDNLADTALAMGKFL